MLTPAKLSRVGLAESNPSLAEQYSPLGAAALVIISDTNTIPFRVINQTSQPVTSYSRTNFGHISLYQQPPAVSVINTNETETTSTSSTIGFDFSHANLNEKQPAQLADLIELNLDVFAKTDHELGHTTLVQHINTGEAQPIRQQPYRVSPAVQNRMNERVEKMLGHGTIQPSVSPWQHQ